MRKIGHGGFFCFSIDFIIDNINTNYNSTNYKSIGFKPLPNATYFLHVNDITNGLFAIGQLKTSIISHLIVNSLADNLTINELFTINSPVNISIFENEIHSSTNFCIERENKIYLESDLTDVFEIELCGFYSDFEYQLG